MSTGTITNKDQAEESVENVSLHTFSTNYKSSFK